MTLQPTQAGAPAFPAVLAAGSGAAPNTAWTVDPDFEVARMWQNNVQFERGSGRALLGWRSGFTYTRGYNLPVVSQHQPDQPDRRAARRPADLQHGDQRGDTRSTRATT